MNKRKINKEACVLQSHWKDNHKKQNIKVSFFPLSVPRHFCFRPDVLDELARKRLLRRLGEN